jgi:hypothetical protein
MSQPRPATVAVVAASKGELLAGRCAFPSGRLGKGDRVPAIGLQGATATNELSLNRAPTRRSRLVSRPMKAFSRNTVEGRHIHDLAVRWLAVIGNPSDPLAIASVLSCAELSPARPSSPSRTRACSTSCANRCSSKPRQPTCSRSSAAQRVKATVRGIRRTLGTARSKKAPATAERLLAMAANTDAG